MPRSFDKRGPLVFLYFFLLGPLSKASLAQFAAAKGKAAAAQQPSSPQFAPPPTASSSSRPLDTLVCPGSFPSDLTLLNCRYTMHQRAVQFFTTGVTDQAMVQSLLGPVFRQIPNKPLTGWNDYGYQVGTSYTGSVGRATAEFIVGSILHTDPRHVSCSSDPRMYRNLPGSGSKNGDFRCTNLQRFNHFLLDSVTVRFSKADGLQHRLPAIDRLAGIYGGAYAQYPLEPRSQNSFVAVTQRSLFSFGTTFFGSFYTEYGTSFLKLRRKTVSNIAE